MINKKISHDFLGYLIDNYKVEYVRVFWSETPLKSIILNDSIFPLELGRKSLTDKLFWLEESEWNHLGDYYLKNTIKKFVNDI